MATLRQKLVRELGELMALDPDKYREIVAEEIERRFAGFWAYPSEKDYYRGLTPRSRAMFAADVRRVFEETATQWAKTIDDMNKWIADETAASNAAAAAAAAAHSEEYEAVEEIMAEEEEVQQDAIKRHNKLAAAACAKRAENARRKEVDQGGTIALIDSLTEATSEYGTYTTVVDCGGMKCIVRKLNADETLTLFIEHDTRDKRWEVRAGNVFNRRSGISWQVAQGNLFNMSSPTWKIALEKFCNWYRGGA